MPDQINLTEADRKLLAKVLIDVSDEVDRRIEREIANNVKDEKQLTEIAWEVAKRITKRDLMRALAVVAGETYPEGQAKLERSDLLIGKLPELLKPYFTNEVPYVIALKRATDPKLRIASSSLQSLKEVIEHVEALKKEGIEKVSDLTRALNATTMLLNKEISSDQYKTVAFSMRGATSLGLGVLSILMLALCVTLAVTGAGWIAVATTGLLSVGLFAANAPIGLSRAMSSLAKDEQKEAGQTAAPAFA